MAVRRPRSPRVANNHHNRILAALPPAELRVVARDLSMVELPHKVVLHEVGAPIRNVYFVETGIVSVLAATVDGTAVEVATVGPEGLVGLPVALGTDRGSSQAVVQIPGRAWALPVPAFRRHVENGSDLRNIVYRYTQAMFTMLAQSSACNRLHSVQERCARWLLTTRDRLSSNVFELTHEFMAQMLGVRRASVSEVLGELKADQLIDLTRGKITLLAPERLEALACECYFIINAEFDRLLGGKKPSAILEKIRRNTSKKEGGRRVTKARPPPKKRTEAR